MSYLLQSLRHRPDAQFVKIASLSLGLLMAILLFARIAFELSFDDFFRRADCLYLVKTGWLKDGMPDGGESDYTIIPIPGIIAAAYPDRVEGATVSCHLFADDYTLGERKWQLGTVMADTLYFSVMGLDLLRGNAQDLAAPDALFLSETAARRLFGDGDPLGQSVQYDFWGQPATLLVKGVFRDVPLNTSLPKRPEALVSFPSIERHTRWGMGWQSGGNYNGFLRLRSPQDAAWLNERLSALVARHLPPESGLELSVHIEPLKGRYLRQPDVRRRLGVMSFLGLALLLAATLNYILISVASLTGRAKAVGVHKCSGATGGAIFRMFLWETAAVILLSLLLMVLLVYLFAPWVEELAAVPLSVLFAWKNLWASLLVLLLLFVLGGGIPACLFARIPVSQVFRRYSASRRGWKHLLLFLEFGGAAFVLGMMLVVFAQYRHDVGRDRGWSVERVAYLYQRSVDAARLRDEVRRLPYVEAAAAASWNIFSFGSNRPVPLPQGEFYPRNAWFDGDYLPFIRLRLKEGRNLTGDRQLLVNAPFCQRMHWTGSPIGKTVGDYGTVVGLLDSFAFIGAPDDAEPVMVEWDPAPSGLHVRLKEPFTDNLARLNAEMQRLYPQEELLFHSLEQERRDQFQSTRVFRNVTLLASLSVLAIILLGLVGYMNDEVRLRSKEIAIRKVNGASARSILRLLTCRLLWLALPALTLGLAASRLAGHAWQEQFADAASLPVAASLLLGLALLAFILLVAGLKAKGIADENPVLSLKSE